MITIILSHPQMGENIGGAARAMMNFGLCNLRLVHPRDGWPNERADAMAAGAFERMPPVEVFDTLEEAIADLHFVFATTARARHMVKPVFTPEKAAREGYGRMQKGQNIGIVFGAERTGMLNDEITHTQALITIPTDPDFSSLNLGQSVLLLAYEWIKASQEGKTTEESSEHIPAPQKDINMFINRLNEDLEARHFFRAAGLKSTLQRNLRNIFSRADISEQELRTLHGVLSALRGNKGQK